MAGNDTLVPAISLVYGDQVVNVCFIHHCQTNYERTVLYLSIVRDELSSTENKSDFHKLS